MSNEIIRRLEGKYAKYLGHHSEVNIRSMIIVLGMNNKKRKESIFRTFTPSKRVFIANYLSNHEELPPMDKTLRNLMGDLFDMMMDAHKDWERADG